MSGGSKQVTTGTATTAPFAGATPGLNYAMGKATDLAKSGSLVKPLTMSTVVPFANQTTQGMGQIQNMANEAMSPGGYYDMWKGISASGGYNPAQQTAMEGIRNTATGAFDINANPAFQQVLGQAQDAASNAVNASASGMGRYGSGAHQGTLAREVGDLTSRMVSDEYRNWQGRQDTAQRDLFNIGQTGQQNMATAFERMQDPANALMGVGSQYEDLYGRQLNDSLRIAQETQNQPLANLQALMGILSGAGAYNTTTQTAQLPSNTMSNIAGGLLGGASLLKGIL